MAGAHMTAGCVQTNLVTAAVVRGTSALAAAPLPRLVLKVAAVVDGVAHVVQRDALLPLAAVEFRLGVALGNP